MTKTSNLANFYGGENLWPDASTWKPGDEDSNAGSSATTSANRQKETTLESSKSFYQLRRSPAATGTGPGTVKCSFSTNNILASTPGDQQSIEDSLLASLSPEYAEIDSLGTFGNSRRYSGYLSGDHIQ